MSPPSGILAHEVHIFSGILTVTSHIVIDHKSPHSSSYMNNHNFSKIFNFIGQMIFFYMFLNLKREFKNTVAKFTYICTIVVRSKNKPIYVEG